MLLHKEKEFFDTHRTFRFDTIYEEGEYEIIAVVLTEVGYPGDDLLTFLVHLLKLPENHNHQKTRVDIYLHPY